MDPRIATIEAMIAQRSQEIANETSNNYYSPRELSDSENTIFSSRPREVYKDENTKRLKHISRVTDADRDEEKVSSSPTFGPDQRSAPDRLDFVISPEKTSLSQEEGDIVNLEPRELSDSGTESYSGISVQHARARKGVKLFVTLQTPAMAEHGVTAPLTVELKRYDRLREIKSLETDSDQFHDYMETTKQDLRQLPNRKSVCMGRMHVRGKRSMWQYDCMAVAFLQDDVVRQVCLYLEGEEYLINLTEQLSPRQEKFYLSLGYHGRITSNKSAPRLCDVPLRKFGV